MSRSLWWHVQVIANSAVSKILCTDDLPCRHSKFVIKDTMPTLLADCSGCEACVYDSTSGPKDQKIISA